MKRGIPYRDTPRTFLFIHFNSKKSKSISNNTILFVTTNKIYKQIRYGNKLDIPNIDRYRYMK